MPRRTAFTLVELLVVIAIIGVLIALLLPAVQAARESARRTHCLNNCKQLGLAVHMHHDSQQQLPPSRMWDGGFTWAGVVLPYMEEATIRDLADFTLDFSAQPDAVKLTPVSTFLCPSRARAQVLSYTRAQDIPDVRTASGGAIRGANNTVGIQGDYGCVSSTFRSQTRGGKMDQFFDGAIIQPKLDSARRYASRTRLAKISDGASNTLMIAENSYLWAARVCLYDGRDSPGSVLGLGSLDRVKAVLPSGGRGVNFGERAGGSIARDPTQGSGSGCESGAGCEVMFGGDHTNVINVTLCDGSARALRKDIELAVAEAFVTRAAGDIADRGEL